MVTYLIYFFSVLLLFSSAIVIIARNPLHSVLALVGSFLFSSVLIFLFENEFLALFFLIIYLGAIAILFLFVVMMLDVRHKIKDPYTKTNLILTLVVGLVFLVAVAVNK